MKTLEKTKKMNREKKAVLINIICLLLIGINWSFAAWKKIVLLAALGFNVTLLSILYLEKNKNGTPQ